MFPSLPMGYLVHWWSRIGVFLIVWNVFMHCTASSMLVPPFFFLHSFQFLPLLDISCLFGGSHSTVRSCWTAGQQVERLILHMVDTKISPGFPRPSIALQCRIMTYGKTPIISSPLCLLLALTDIILVLQTAEFFIICTNLSCKECRKYLVLSVTTSKFRILVSFH